MHATLLVFLAAAWLNALALDLFLFDSAARRERLASGVGSPGTELEFAL